MRVTALLAHPDDELMCAGTLARMVDAGHDVTLHTMFVDGRRAEWEAASDAIGCEAVAWGSIDEDLFCWDRENVRRIEAGLNGTPDLLISHRPDDHNTSHGHLGRIAETLARKNRTSLWQIDQVMPGGLCGAAPHMVVNTTGQQVRKGDAVAAYASQLARYEGLAEALAARDAALGWQAGVGSAEGFTVVKAVWL